MYETSFDFKLFEDGNQSIFLKILSEYLRSLVLYSLKYFCKLKAG